MKTSVPHLFCLLLLGGIMHLRPATAAMMAEPDQTEGAQRLASLKFQATLQKIQQYINEQLEAAKAARALAALKARDSAHPAAVNVALVGTRAPVLPIAPPKAVIAPAGVSEPANGMVYFFYGGVALASVLVLSVGLAAFRLNKHRKQEAERLAQLCREQEMRVLKSKQKRA